MVTVVFTGGDSFVDEAIESITQGSYSHVAIQILGGTLESLGKPDKGDKYPGVHLHDLYKYDGQPEVLTIDIDLPYQDKAEDKARSLRGKFYSYIGCIEGGTYDLFGIKLHGAIVKLVNLAIVRVFSIPCNLDTGEWTMNCSETVTRILREGGLNVCPGVDADCVTPMDLYRWLNERSGGMSNGN